MGELGYLGLHFPEEYGGGGGDYFTNIVLLEELQVQTFGVNTGVGGPGRHGHTPILKFGTEEQKQKYLVPAIKGEKIACLGITEPGAGSDVSQVSTYAEKVDGGWMVNGNKIFITNGWRADFMTMLARTEKQQRLQGHEHLPRRYRHARLRGIPEAGQGGAVGLGYGGDLLRGHGHPRGRDDGRGRPGLLQHHVGAAGESASLPRGESPPRETCRTAIDYAKERGSSASPDQEPGCRPPRRRSVTQLEAVKALTYQYSLAGTTTASTRSRRYPWPSSWPPRRLRGRRRGDAAHGRLRLHDGVPGAARLAGHPNRPHRRRHRRDHARDYLQHAQPVAGRKTPARLE